MDNNTDLLTSIKQQIEQKQQLEQALCELTAISPDERSALLADPRGYLAVVSHHVGQQSSSWSRC